MRPMLVASFLVLSVFSLVRAAEPAPDAKPKETAILQQWQGLYPANQVNLLPEGQRAAGMGFIADAKTFAAVWTAWMGKAELPKIDFQKNLVVFARNVQYLNTIRIGGVMLKDGVADVVAMETMSAIPIEDKLHMSAAVIAREGVKAVRIGQATVAVPPPDAAKEPGKAPAEAEAFVYTLKDKEPAQACGPVAVGRKIEVRAAGNPTTGYSWAVKEIKGDAVKSGGEIKYVPTPVAPRVVGSGGTFSIPLEAVKAGKADVVLVYARPWEKDQPPASSVTLAIEVQTAEAKPEGKGEAAPPAKRAKPVPINGKADPRAPGYIVLFENNVDAKAEVARLEKLYGFKHQYIWDSMPGFKGFSAVITNEAIEKISWEPSVRSIDHDGVVSVNGGAAGAQ
jgi:inhibitor of cysteine peptidase